MQPFRIRPAALKDVPLLADVERSASQAFLVLPDYKPSGRTVPAAILNDMALHHRLWVASAMEDKIVGFAGCEDMDGALYLHEISVAFEHQKQGIGRALMATVIKNAVEKNYPAILLTTRRNAKWNMPFYSSLGFKETNDAQKWPTVIARLQQEIADGADPAIRCAMVKEI